MGHMNIMWYTSKFDEATWSFFALIGITPAYVRDQKHGMAAVEQHVFYKKELLAGDIVIVKTEFLELKQKSIRFKHDLINDVQDEVAATCEFTGVHIDLAARKACPFTEDVVARVKNL